MSSQCSVCGGEFVPRRQGTTTCSQRCRGSLKCHIPAAAVESIVVRFLGGEPVSTIAKSYGCYALAVDKILDRRSHAHVRLSLELERRLSEARRAQQERHRRSTKHQRDMMRLLLGNGDSLTLVARCVGLSISSVRRFKLDHIDSPKEPKRIKKLTPAYIQEIHRQLAAGVKGVELARRYNVSPTVISAINHEMSACYRKR